MSAIWIVEGWRAHPGVAAMEVRDQDAFPFAAAGIVRCHGNDATGADGLDLGRSDGWISRQNLILADAGRNP